MFSSTSSKFASSLVSTHPNLFGAKHVQFRFLHQPHLQNPDHQQPQPQPQQSPLFGINVTVLKEASQMPKLIPKLLEKYGANITTFCDISTSKKQSINSGWTNSNFVDANVVYGSFDRKSTVPNGERDVDLRNIQDLNLIKSAASNSDIFFDGLKNQKLENFGIDSTKMLELNSNLIFARFYQPGPDEILNLVGSLGKSESNSEEFLLLMGQQYKSQILLGEILSFSKILSLLSNRRQQSFGQILNMSTSDSLYQITRLQSSLPAIPKFYDRFYSTKDNKVFYLCIQEFDEQQKFLKALNLSNAKKIPSKIRETKYANLQPILREFNIQANFDYLFHQYKMSKLQTDDYYEFDKETNYWKKNNFYHYKTSF